MAKKLDSVRGQIDPLCHEICALIRRIPGPSPIQDGESGFDANRKFHTFMSALSAAMEDLEARPPALKYDERFISRQKQIIDEMSERVAKESEAFANALESMRVDFQKMVQQLTDDYFKRKQECEEGHDYAMSEMMLEILRTRASMDDRIEREREEVINEKCELRQRIRKDREQFGQWKAEIEMHLKNMEEKNAEDERYIKALREERESAQCVEKDEAAQRRKGEERVEELEKEKKRLEEKLARIRNELEPRVAQMKEKLRAAREENEAEIKPLIAIRREELEKEMKEVIERGRAESDELRRTLERRSREKDEEIEALKGQLQDLEVQVNEKQAELGQKMRQARLEAKEKVRAKEAEVNRVREGNAKEIEAMEAEFREKVKEQKVAIQQEIVRLEKQLKETVSQLDERRKKLNGGKVSVEPELKAPAPIVSPRRRKEEETKDAFGNIRTSFSISESESKAMYDEVMKRKGQHNAEIRAQKTRLRDEMKELEKEKHEFEAWIEDMNKKIGEMELVKEEFARSEKEEDLMKKVAMQKSTIAQLKEERDEARVESGKEQALKELYAQQKQAIAEIESEKQEVQNSLAMRLNEVSAEMSQKLGDERKKNQDLILEAAKKLDVALSQLLKAKQASETIVMEDYKKWKELRTEIGETTSTICNRVSQRPPVAQIAHLNGMQVLPPLRS